MLVIGTRPEGIKMIPLYFALLRSGMDVAICSTSQHDQLLDEVFKVFGVKPHINLKIMKPGQDLYHVTTAVLEKTKAVFEKEKPDLVLVQGDTTTVLAAALSAFYQGIEVGHVEAGLRTWDIRSPFPEEVNRKIVSTFADYNFAPTQQSVDNLLKEGIDPNKIYCVGNTVVDALRIIKDLIIKKRIEVNDDIVGLVEKCQSKKQQIVLLTAHRRESFNGGIERILTAVKNFALKHPEVFFFYPYHPNPNVLQAIEKVNLKEVENIHLTEPLRYKEMVYLQLNTNWMMTDSGGIQEEGVSLGKNVLVLREKTERPEGIEAGLAHLVGTDIEKITRMMEECSSSIHSSENDIISVYGDGYTSEKIVGVYAQKMLNQNKSECNT